MATLSSVRDELEFELRCLGKEYDPFQMDLEWFEYELSVRVVGSPSDDDEADDQINPEGSTIRGKINRKHLIDLIAELDALLSEGQVLRFEPPDLSFYLEWSRETEHVCLIVVWFDVALTPRSPDQAFPTAHTGFRFLADDRSVREFRKLLTNEFLKEPGPQTSSPLVH